MIIDRTNYQYEESMYLEFRTLLSVPESPVYQVNKLLHFRLCFQELLMITLSQLAYALYQPLLLCPGQDILAQPLQWTAPYFPTVLRERQSYSQKAILNVIFGCVGPALAEEGEHLLDESGDNGEQISLELAIEIYVTLFPDKGLSKILFLPFLPGVGCPVDHQDCLEEL